MSDGEIKLTVQNAVEPILTLAKNPGGRIVLLINGDFSGGDVEIGFINASSVFEVFTGGTSNAKDDYELTTGVRDVFARATGATPDIDLDVSRVY